MKRRFFAPLLAVLMLGLTVGFASVATALPTKTTPCSGCHDLDASVHLTAAFVSATATGTTYAIGVNNPYGLNGWAVFQGSTKFAGTAGSGTNVTLPNGVTSTVFGVSGDGAGTQGYATLSLTPATPDLTAPTTTSNALATYLSSVSITLSAHDNVGGSGVAHTYYILDSGTQTEGTTVGTTVVGTHTLEFWSVDASSNAETPHNFANFQITAAPPVATKYTVVYKFNLKKKVYKKLKAVLTSKTNSHVRYTVLISKKGVATFRNIPRGLYKLSTTGNARFKFKARTVRVGPA